MQPPPDDGPGTVESPPDADPDAFDPGVETGYLRRAPREGPPDVELGAHPFDPGEDVGFDDRRAKKRRRQREREERERAEAQEAERHEAAAKAELERERERTEADELERREAEALAREEAEEAERHEAELARLEEAERELEEAEERAVAEAERARRESERQDLAEREARARAEAERAEREAEALRRREERERERAEAKRRRKLAADEKARARRKRAAAAPPKPPTPPAAVKATSPRPAPATQPRRASRPAPARPPARRRVRRPARPMPPPGTQTQTERTREPPSLRRPTAKLGATAIAIVAGAMLLGSAAGLPTPFSGSEGGVASLNAQGVPVGSGIAASLYRGPFHPVRGDYDYGEKGAEFGADRGGRKHEGQDIFSKRGTPLVAVRDGVVVDRAKENSTYSGGRGNYVAIYSPIENRSFVYLHLLEPAPVEKGDRVHAGQLVGLMGCTGSCYGTHLHFEVRRGRATFAADTKAINPRPYLDDLPQAPEELAEP